MSASEPPSGLDATALEAAWQQGQVVLVAPPQAAPAQAASAPLAHDQPQPSPAALQALAATWGPGVVVGSGGSTGGRRWCLQPLPHLQASAAATAAWLLAQGLDPARCVHLNPLPLHHVSGLLPLVRARSWGANHRIVPPALMRRPHALAEALPLPPGQPALISLVPTQLARLLADPAARAWLRQLAVVWVGGGALPEALALAARQEDIRLSPCYGATETAAMVCALAPERFLAGDAGCGHPLADVDLRLDLLTGTVEVATDRLSPGWIDAHGTLQPLPRTTDGRWCSGDAGVLTPAGLEILGRRDGAILSGGETVFPEQLEARLRALAQREGWPLQEVLLLGVSEPEWGQRLTALVRPRAGAQGVAEHGAALIGAMRMAVMAWPVAERPRRWLLCDTLAPSPTGKWQRSHWQRWLASLEADHTPLT